MSLTPQPLVPPHDIDAEQGLLGALIYDNANLESACERLRGRHFYDPVHGRIFDVIEALVKNKRLADAVTLRAHFASDDSLQDIGGAAYLLTLLENAARMPTHAKEYGELIYDMAMRRAAIKEIDAARAHLFSDFATNAADHLVGLEKKIASFSGVAATDEDISLREAGRLAIEKYRAGGRGISTGLATLDDMVAGLFPEDLIVIAGRPGMGKTGVVDNIARSVASKDLVVAFWSGEMAAEQIAERALSSASHGQRDEFQYRAFRRRELPIEFASKLQQYLPSTLVINRRGAITLDRLRAFCRRVRRLHGRLDLIVVDYLQLMTDEAVKHGETAQVTAISGGLKALAKDSYAPLIALSQLSRQVEERDDKRPRLSDLRQSGSIEQDADIVLFVYREHYYLEREEPRPKSGEGADEFNIRHAQWATRVVETAGKAEIIAGKARHDSIGAQWVSVDLGYDRVSDIQGPHK